MKVAVTWQMSGFVDIDAPTMEEAVDKFLDNRDNIAIPKDGEYIEESLELGSEDPEVLKMFADIQTEAVECCPFCGGENVFPNWNVKKQGYIAKCQHCGEAIMLCDECRHAADNCGKRCDWHEEIHGNKALGICFRGMTKHQK